jgi:predicted ATPase with chaperone activity
MPVSIVVQSAVLSGESGHAVWVQVNVPVYPLPPRFDDDGIVRAALCHLGVPHTPYTAAILPESVPSFDSANLSIALALLAAHDEVSARALTNVFALGRLRANATIQPVCGVFSRLVGIHTTEGPLVVLTPHASVREARSLAGIVALPADSLHEAAARLRETTQRLPTPAPEAMTPTVASTELRGEFSAFAPVAVAALDGEQISRKGGRSWR